MPVQARRVFRLSGVMAVSLALSYAMQMDLPFIAPIFALLLTAAPGPPKGLKALVGLSLVLAVTLGVGLLLVPLLLNYPVTAILIAGAGIYFSNYVSVNLGKGAVGALLTAGVTLISAAGTLSFPLAVTVIEALVLGVGIAVISQWIVYPWFPENESFVPPAPPAATPSGSNWIALRATLVVLPAYQLALTNPAMYLPIIMKSVSLGQQSSVVDARDAGRVLLGSTFLGGCFAIVFWFALGVATNLWTFTLLMLLVGVYFSGKLYQVIPTKFPAAFWQNVVVTMLILLGSAVQDSDSGKDVYQAFAVRMSLFVAVTCYAWFAIEVLELLRSRRLGRPEDALGVGGG